MGILVNFVSAHEEDIEAIGESQHPVDEWSGIEVRDIDRAKIIALHCLVTGDGIEDAVYAYEPVYSSYDDGPIVIRMSEYLVQRLAEFDEDALEAVGEELAASEDFETSDLPPEEVQTLVTDLATLASNAVTQGQNLYVWMHPLLT